MGIDIRPVTTTQRVLGLAGKNQEVLQKVSIQIASGSQYEDYKGFAGDGTVERVLSFNNSLAVTETYLKSNDVIFARVDTADQSVQQIQELASDLSQLITRKRNSASSDNVPLGIEGKSILDNIAGKLNVKFDGKYLFAGTKSNTKPIQSIQTSNLDAKDNPTNSYYSGDSTTPIIKIDDSQTLAYGVTGDELAFQQLIGAAHLAIEGHNDNSDDKLSAAVDMINLAISNLASLRATIGSNKQTIIQSNAVHRDFNILISENLINISQTNIVEATTKMSELEGTIQATYIAFQRLNGLRLSNFLN